MSWVDVLLAPTGIITTIWKQDLQSLQIYHFICGLVFLFAISPLVWRFLRPVALRALYADAPDEVPSWMPLIGNQISSLRDWGATVRPSHSGLIAAGMPFSLLFSGVSVSFLVSAKDSDFIHHSAAAFPHGQFIKRAADKFGVGKDGVRRIWALRGGRTRDANLFAQMMATCRRELSALSKIGGFPAVTMQNIYDFGREGHMTRQSIIRSDSASTTLSLSAWVR